MSFFRQGKRETGSLTDEQLVRLILDSGDSKGFELLYDRFAQRVYYKCVSLLKDREEAKDLTHDILLKVFLNLVKFEGRSSFSLWVHSITYNYCIDYLKKQKRLRMGAFEEEVHEDIADDVAEQESRLLQELKLTQLGQVFDKLAIEDQIILMMRYQDDLPVKKIAETLQISESATKMRLKRSRDHLALLIQQLNRQDDGW
jgi:RNA polymerase sigma-70 factor (ECF subfamily)